MPSTETDITTLIDQQKMRAVQYGTILICFMMNMLDGTDVLVISFQGSAIRGALGVSPSALDDLLGDALIGCCPV